METTDKAEKTLADLPQKLIKFADLVLAGKTAALAARECGYSKSTAGCRAYGWIGKTRETSVYPALYDYFHEKRKEKLRLFDVSIDSVVNELKLIAFSSIDHYLDLPTIEARRKIERITERLRAEEKKLERFINPDYLEIERKIQENPDVKLSLRGVKRYTPEAKDQLAKCEKIAKELRHAENGPGVYLRLKFKEEIPAELIPAIAEIRQTREGIALKLHSKLDALDSLAKWQKMYVDKPEGNEDAPANIQEINLVVNGSRSKLMRINDDQAAA